MTNVPALEGWRRCIQVAAEYRLEIVARKGDTAEEEVPES